MWKGLQKNGHIRIQDKVSLFRIFFMRVVYLLLFVLLLSVALAAKPVESKPEKTEKVVKEEKTEKVKPVKEEKVEKEQPAKVEKVAAKTEKVEAKPAKVEKVESEPEKVKKGKAEKAAKVPVAECATAECILQKQIDNKNEYAKLLQKLTQVQAQLSVSSFTGEVSATGATTINSNNATLNANKLDSKLAKIQAKIAALEAAGVDGQALKTQWAADKQAQEAELAKARLDALWKSQQASKAAVNPAPVYEKRGKSLAEITSYKIAQTEAKLAELKQKLEWINSNPQISDAASVSAAVTSV